MSSDGVREGERREWALLVLAGIFVTHALLGELLGGKLIEMRGWIMSVGVIPWPLVFVTNNSSEPVASVEEVVSAAARGSRGSASRP